MVKAVIADDNIIMVIAPVGVMVWEQCMIYIDVMITTKGFVLLLFNKICLVVLNLITVSACLNNINMHSTFNFLMYHDYNH